ncbi:MAG: hypothetical protein JO198_01615, partial [Candidatus Dormibacteraeota bacterium]|nr:hypothetical protein [Candidatus Dormibacteraeota bacterium]
MSPDNAIDPLVALHDLAVGAELDESDITRAVEEAVVAAYRRTVEDDPAIVAHVDLAGGRWQVYRNTAEGEVPVEVSLDFP